MVDHGPSPTPVFFEKPNGERVPIPGNCTIGRSHANEIVLPDDRVSRRHALIHVQDASEYWLVDLGSGNGTYLNGRRLTQPTRLRDGDEVEISEFRHVFRQPQSAPGIEASATLAGATVLYVQSSKCWLLVADLESSSQLAQSVPAEQVPMITGRWLAQCKQLIEKHDGTINKFLGDGFFAYWRERGETAGDVTRALVALTDLQAHAKPHFRVVLHYGDVFVGGAGSMGEESLSGKEVNVVFRMEKLAAGLREPCLLSEAAKTRLGSAMTMRDVGLHSLPGIEGRHRFFGNSVR